MIHNTKTKKRDHVTIVSFGEGAFSFSAGYSLGSSGKFILSKKDGHTNLHTPTNEGINSIKDNEPEVIFEFKNKNSFDYFIDFLTIARNIFIQEEVKQQ